MACPLTLTLSPGGEGRVRGTSGLPWLKRLARIWSHSSVVHPASRTRQRNSATSAPLRSRVGPGRERAPHKAIEACRMIHKRLRSHRRLPLLDPKCVTKSRSYQGLWTLRFFLVVVEYGDKDQENAQKHRSSHKPDCPVTMLVLYLLEHRTSFAKENGVTSLTYSHLVHSRQRMHSVESTSI